MVDILKAGASKQSKYSTNFDLLGYFQKKSITMFSLVFGEKKLNWSKNSKL